MLLHILDMQCRPHQEDDKQVSGVEGVKEPLGDFGFHMGGQEDQGRGQDGLRSFGLEQAKAGSAA